MKPKVTLLNPEEIIKALETIGDFARVCYDSYAKAEKIAEHVIEHNHATAYRHIKFRFSIEGVSRAFSHQHVRHNVGVEHNQRSQRYVDEDGFAYVMPPRISSNPEAQRLFDELMTDIKKVYNQLYNLGIPREDARYVLPNACETKINTAFSFQALRHYCAERLCTAAQWEIRKVARLMVEEVKKVNPEIAKYLVVKCHPNALGYCPEDLKRWEACRRRPHKKEVIK